MFNKKLVIIFISICFMASSTNAMSCKVAADTKIGSVRAMLNKVSFKGMKSARKSKQIVNTMSKLIGQIYYKRVVDNLLFKSNEINNYLANKYSKDDSKAWHKEYTARIKMYESELINNPSLVKDIVAKANKDLFEVSTSKEKLEELFIELGGKPENFYDFSELFNNYIVRAQMETPLLHNAIGKIASAQISLILPLNYRKNYVSYFEKKNIISGEDRFIYAVLTTGFGMLGLTIYGIASPTDTYFYHALSAIVLNAGFATGLFVKAKNNLSVEIPRLRLERTIKNSFVEKVELTVEQINENGTLLDSSLVKNIKSTEVAKRLNSLFFNKENSYEYLKGVEVILRDLSEAYMAISILPYTSAGITLQSFKASVDKMKNEGRAVELSEADLKILNSAEEVINGKQANLKEIQESLHLIRERVESHKESLEKESVERGQYATTILTVLEQVVTIAKDMSGHQDNVRTMINELRNSSQGAEYGLPKLSVELGEILKANEAYRALLPERFDP